MIDYSVGGGIEYTPFLTVMDWIHRGDEERLRKLVKGRAVVVASLLPTEPRHRLPVQLAGWDPGSRTEPAAVVHIQALRSLLARGLIERAPENLSLALAALGALFWFGRGGWLKGLAAVGGAGRLLGPFHLCPVAGRLPARGEHRHGHVAGLRRAPGLGFHPAFPPTTDAAHHVRRPCQPAGDARPARRRSADRGERPRRRKSPCLPSAFAALPRARRRHRRKR
jgi:hypothetical protein